MIWQENRRSVLQRLLRTRAYEVLCWVVTPWYDICVLLIHILLARVARTALIYCTL
jgi:hypothetical protein